MLKEYYNTETKTLTLPYEFNEELKDLPIETQAIIFEENRNEEYSKFNQKVDNLPTNLTQLSFGTRFNQKVDNLPLNLKQLNICETQVYYFKKIPFGCRIMDEDDNEIFV